MIQHQWYAVLPSMGISALRLENERQVFFDSLKAAL